MAEKNINKFSFIKKKPKPAETHDAGADPKPKPAETITGNKLHNLISKCKTADSSKWVMFGRALNLVHHLTYIAASMVTGLMIVANVKGDVHPAWTLLPAWLVARGIIPPHNTCIAIVTFLIAGSTAGWITIKYYDPSKSIGETIGLFNKKVTDEGPVRETTFELVPGSPRSESEQSNGTSVDKYKELLSDKIRKQYPNHYPQKN